MMKLGLVSAILPDYTFEQVFDFAAETGFECVEVCCWPKGKAARRYAGVTHIDLEGLDEAKMNYYLEYATKKGVAISSLGYYPNPLDANTEAAEVAVAHLKNLIEVSGKMGVKMVTTFIGRNKDKTIEENFDLYKETWSPLIELAEKHGVKVAIENCPMLYTQNEWPGGNNMACSPYVWREMFSLIKSDCLGLNFDPSHPYLQGSSYLKPLYEFKDKLFHIHFKDIKIYQDKLDDYGHFAYPALWHSPKLPGLGGVNFGAFCSALNDIRYEGFACIEVEDKAYEANVNDVLHGIRQSYRYMKNLM